MDLERVFRMNGGAGETSYSKNCSLQKKASDKVKHIVLEAIERVLEATSWPKSIGIADLGCSSGPNTLLNIKDIVEAAETAAMAVSREVPEFRVYLNDLPTNDFNTIFHALPEWYRKLTTPSCVYVAAYPGSFYGRLFPDNFLHFIYSSNSLHWLSRVPSGIYDEKGVSINKKSIYISKTSPPRVQQAYHKQFEQDFSSFLKWRSRELILGGQMVLILLGRTGPDHVHNIFWEILYQSLATLAAQGEVAEDKLDSYEVHFYAPSTEELEEQVRKEGSFKVESVQVYETDKDAGDCSSYGVAVAKAVRSIQESMLVNHFGVTLMLDKLFHHYANLVDQHMLTQDNSISSISIALLLTKVN
ncbi:S-adenosyl-L-methionine-dependent methyltransferase superfamily protein [Dorcoceras hygrometricum]|uniref:S-adenosyl-L-methionine-dependent methyltransferase superfamily protein n=1 Tax=Dorcoceras hygrometricum TaxID=472368 RepID=A0A2Z7ALI7_9LAMI|nr:S-adenosyl-L-methionine-dependent methyltransferase superfamily protein [Dorcoceras hygrometricum]